jgi:hypothetical protein
MRYLAGFLSFLVALAIAPLVVAQNSEGTILTPSKLKTPSARISEGYHDLSKKAHTPRLIDGGIKDPNHAVTAEEHQAIPYRPCIDARGWKNGRLVCADEAEPAQPQNSHEVEGPYSPR